VRRPCAAPVLAPADHARASSVSTLFMLATQEESDKLEFQPLLKENISKLRRALDEGQQPEELRPTPQHEEDRRPLLLPSRSQLEELEALREGRDLKSVALTMARLGRRFIY
jgi:hypothetical protein